MKLIDKDAVLAEIEKLIKEVNPTKDKVGIVGSTNAVKYLKEAYSTINSLEVKEVDNIWHEVDYINPPQADKNKIYCVFTKQKYILAKVINHPQDEDLLQWKCTEFPHHRYDMCEGDKYIQIV